MEKTMDHEMETRPKEGLSETQSRVVWWCIGIA